MNNIFDTLFQYGFHDTEISAIDSNNLEIKIKFNKGIYLLDERGTETILSNPMQMVLKVNPRFDNSKCAFEIREYGKRLKYIDYLSLKKYLQEESFQISMVYYSRFDQCILFDGGINKKQIMLSIEGIEEITFHELKMG